LAKKQLAKRDNRRRMVYAVTFALSIAISGFFSLFTMFGLFSYLWGPYKPTLTLQFDQPLLKTIVSSFVIAIVGYIISANAASKYRSLK